MTSINQQPETIAQISSQGSATFCGLSVNVAERAYGALGLLGHGFLGLSGKFSGNYWEMGTGFAWCLGSITMTLLPGSITALKTMAVATILGSASLAVGSVLHKEHYAGHLVFCTLAVARCSFLLLKNHQNYNSPILQYTARNKRELNAGIGFPSRFGLLADGILNHQPLVAAAAVVYQICDFCLFASGRAGKRVLVLVAPSRQH